MGGGSWVVAVIRLVLSVISLLGYPRGNETTPLALEKMSRLQSALQLANEGERTALEMAEEARHMAEKALEEEPKRRRKRERLELSVQKLRKKPCFLKRSRECRSPHAFCH